MRSTAQFGPLPSPRSYLTPLILYQAWPAITKGHKMPAFLYSYHSVGFTCMGSNKKEEPHKKLDRVLLKRSKIKGNFLWQILTNYKTLKTLKTLACFVYFCISLVGMRCSSHMYIHILPSVPSQVRISARGLYPLGGLRGGRLLCEYSTQNTILKN